MFIKIASLRYKIKHLRQRNLWHSNHRMSWNFTFSYARTQNCLMIKISINRNVHCTVNWTSAIKRAIKSIFQCSSKFLNISILEVTIRFKWEFEPVRIECPSKIEWKNTRFQIEYCSEALHYLEMRILCILKLHFCVIK